MKTYDKTPMEHYEKSANKIIEKWNRRRRRKRIHDAIVLLLCIAVCGSATALIIASLTKVITGNLFVALTGR